MRSISCRSLTWFLSLTLLSASFVACSSGTEGLSDLGGNPDATPALDASADAAAPTDSGADAGSIDSGTIDSGTPDSGPTASGIGTSCTSPGGFPPPQGSCGEAQLCLGTDFGFPDGYCSSNCGRTSCPSDATCVQLGGPSLCFQNCTHNSECRGGTDYVCQDHVCLPLGFGGEVTPGTNDGAACVMPVVVAPGAGSLFSASLSISEPSTNVLAAECELAVDPITHHVVVAYNDLDLQSGGSLIGVAVSDDDGLSFRTPFTLPIDTSVDHNTNQSDPVVGVDPAGHFFISWVGFDTDARGNTINFHIYVARSLDGGHSFTVFNAAPTESGDLDKPWLAINPVDGSMLVTYEKSNAQGTNSDIRMVRSSSGASWSAPVSINEARPEFRNLAQTAFGNDGRHVSVWVELVQTSTSMFGSRDNSIWAQRFGANGVKIGSNVRVTAGLDSPSFEDPSVAVFGDLVYVGFISGDLHGAWDVRVATSTNGGATFMPSVKVNDDLSCATHFHHQIIVDQQGNLHALWFDNRYLTGNVFHAVAAPATAGAPLAFGPSTFVNDASFTFTTSRSSMSWLGDYLGVTLKNGKMYAAWTDNRNGGLSRIYFASGATH